MDLTALRSGGFRGYLAANFLSINGIWINRITIGWLAWSLTDSTVSVGTVSFLLYAPTLVTGPFFGALTDRINVKRGAFVTQAILALLTLTLGVFAVIGQINIWTLSVLAALFGLTASANSPIRLTLVPLLVDPKALANAITLISINFNAARLIGPAIGGMVIAQWGVGPTCLASFMLMLPMLAALPFLPARGKQIVGTQENVTVQLVEGLWRVSKSAELRGAMAITAVTSVVAGGALEVLPAVVDGPFDMGVAGLGQALSAAGAGALTCGISMTLWGQAASTRLRLQRCCPWMLAGTVAVFALGFASHWPAVVFIAFLLGAVGTFTSVTTQAVVQLDAEDAFRGRAIGLWLFVSVGGSALGALGFGALGDLINIRAALITMGALGIAAAMIAAASLLRKRPKQELGAINGGGPTVPADCHR